MVADITDWVFWEEEVDWWDEEEEYYDYDLDGGVFEEDHIQ